MYKRQVILADGNFPVHPVPLAYLRKAEHIICCDGSIMNLDGTGLEAEAIVGDLDSIDHEIARKYSGRLFRDPDQETKMCIRDRSSG